MPTLRHKPNPLSTEARRFVRLLGESVKHSDDIYVRTAPLLCQPIADRLQRYPKRPVREDLLFDLVRGFRRLSPEYRLALDVTQADKHGFALVDYRICTSEWTDSRWNDTDWQGSIALCRITLRIDRGTATTTVPLVNLSYHSLGRFYERARQHSTAALLDAVKPLLSSAEIERVPAGDGYWLGSISRCHGPDGRQFNNRSVRSYLAAEMLTKNTD